MRRHSHRQISKGAERCEIGGVKRCCIGGNGRQIKMAVTRRAAMAGHVLDHGQHAACKIGRGNSTCDGGDRRRIRAVTAVAQKRMRGIRGNIGDGCAVGVYAHSTQFRCNKAGT